MPIPISLSAEVCSISIEKEVGEIQSPLCENSCQESRASFWGKRGKMELLLEDHSCFLFHTKDTLLSVKSMSMKLTMANKVLSLIVQENKTHSRVKNPPLQRICAK